jgi:prophage DNA circulation protein
MREHELMQGFADRIARLDALRRISNMDDREDELNTAYDNLSLAGSDALASPSQYLLALARFLELIMAGDADRLAPELRIEIETGELSHSLQVAEASMLVSAYAVLLLGRTYQGRPEAVRARAVLSGMVDRIAETAGDVLGYENLEAFLEHTGKVSRDLTVIAANQVPIVRVEIGARVPSTLMAWKLYQDPARAGELLERNGIATPAYMPETFEALSA